VAEDGFWATVVWLKAALDPEGIIALGRYDPGGSQPMKVQKLVL
jgi:hypothetical protein